MRALAPRLVFLIPTLALGGAERVAVTLFPFLARSFRLSVVLLENRVSYRLPEGIAPLAFSNRLSGPAAHILRIPYHIAALARLVRRTQTPVVLSFMEQANIINILASFLTGHEAVIVQHNPPPFSHGPEGGILGRAILAATRRLYPKARHIITVSEGIKRILKDDFGHNPNRITAIPNPIDLARITAQAREQPSFPPPEDFILHVGRLNLKQKAQDVLVEAFAVLSQKYPDLKLIFIGDGPDRPPLEALIRRKHLADRVILAGLQSNVFAFMARARLFVLCSHFEGWSMALVEAMASRCPVAAVDGPSGPMEILGRSEFGVLISKLTSQALASAVDGLLRDEALRTHYQKQAYRRAQEFDLAKIGPRYVALIQSILGGGGTRP